MLHSNAFHEFQPRVGSFPTPFISDMAEAASMRSGKSNRIIVSLLRTSYYKRIGLEELGDVVVHIARVLSRAPVLRTGT